mmetsp:Transcript_48314/g.149060  ORF Transcript_48314/g.149060 Transcript_48314/m.149060 type:complete len:230 (-) Transcript_48314:966-1655(-)
MEAPVDPDDRRAVAPDGEPPDVAVVVEEVERDTGAARDPDGHRQRPRRAIPDVRARLARRRPQQARVGAVLHVPRRRAVCRRVEFNEVPRVHVVACGVIAETAKEERASADPDGAAEVAARGPPQLGRPDALEVGVAARVVVDRQPEERHVRPRALVRDVLRRRLPLLERDEDALGDGVVEHDGRLPGAPHLGRHHVVVQVKQVKAHEAAARNRDGESEVAAISPAHPE